MWQHPRWLGLTRRGLMISAYMGGVACCAWMLHANGKSQLSPKQDAIRVNDILVVKIEGHERGWLHARREAFQMAVSVSKIEPDGQLVLKGQRQVSANGLPVETILLSGKVRPEYVGTDKVILSSNMGPLEVERR